jgi:hypothetical protein
MQSSLMTDHNTFGWYLYIPFMFLLFMWGNKLATTDVLNDKPAIGITNSSPGRLNIIIALFTFAVFSTSAKSLLLSNQKPTVQTENTTSISPQVFYASSLTVSDSFMGKNLKILTYNFDGTNLDAKPDYFYNQLIPSGWEQKDQYILNGWNVNKVTKNRQYALILFQYEIDGELSTSARNFKIKRLIKGIKGINQTKLHWGYLDCLRDCTQELKTIEH